MEKYGFVYIWYDCYRNMFYIGCRWGDENDGYICSSNRMRDAYRRRPKDFRRRTLSKVYTNRDDLLEEEYKWLVKIKPEELGKKYYNLRQHKWGHWSTDPDKVLEIGQKISKTLKKRTIKRKMPPRTEEHTKNQRLAMVGKTHTPDTKQKIRETLEKYRKDQKTELSKKPYVRRRYFKMKMEKRLLKYN